MSAAAPITWHNPATTPPPERREILIALFNEEGASVGYHRRSEGGYQLMDDHFIADCAVYAWADLPRPPSAKQLGVRRPRSFRRK